MSRPHDQAVPENTAPEAARSPVDEGDAAEASSAPSDPGRATTPLPTDLRGADLSGADLAGVSLAGRDLRGANLTRANLREADLSGADLSGARLAGADLTGAVAHEAVAHGADLRRAVACGLRARDLDLNRADLSEADLSGAHLSALSATDARLQGARLIGAELDGAELRRADLRDADLSGANLNRADLRSALVAGTRFTDARAAGARFHGLREASAAQIEGLRAAGARGGLTLDREGVERTAGQMLDQLGRGLGRLRPTTLVARWTARGRMEGGRARAAELGGPGADLRDRALTGENLSGAAWAGADLSGSRIEEARLDGADLRETCLDGVRGDGARLRHALLTGAHGENVRLPDADLRDADLRGARLAGADLSGADLRGADLRGADLRHAVLRATRLPDALLEGVVLDGADLDQADVSGARWEGASVEGADISGALGLSEAEREELAARGAKTGVEGGGVITARWARAAVALAALGMGVYLATRFLAPGSVQTTELAAEAEALREANPLEASKKYEAMAAAADRAEDKVGHRLEAASLAMKGGDKAGAERILKDALSAAADDDALEGRTRLRLAELLASDARWSELREVANPLLELEGQPSADRAQGLLLYEDAVAATGGTEDALAAVWERLSALPEAEADLRMALAEARANKGQNEAALTHLDRLAKLTLPEDAALQMLATRARVLDRMGRADDAMAAWRDLLERAEEGSLPAQAARLSLADLRRRQGDSEEARELLEPLLAEDADLRLRGRALLLHGGLAEDAGETVSAIADYRQLIELGGVDVDTVEEARVSLARLLLAEGGETDAADVLAGLPEDVAAAILAQARLGEARRLLEAGQPTEAQRLFEDIERAARGAGDGRQVVEAEVLRDARSGRAEALAAAGQLADAVAIWQELLREGPPADEHDRVSLLLGHVELARGQRDAANEVFARLSASKDPDTRAQGRLGQAEAARVGGEREAARRIFREVASTAEDPSWRVAALEELAEMATEDGRADEVMESWRAILGVVPPGNPAAVSARLALAGALEDAGQINEAERTCASAAAAAVGDDRGAAAVACAELTERHHPPAEARRAWQQLLSRAGADPDAGADAALGVARTSMSLSDPSTAVTATRAGLEVAKRPELRIPLLAAAASARRATGDAGGAAEAESELDRIATSAPEAAARHYGEVASSLRRAGANDEAKALLERALALNPPPALGASLAVELGELLLDLGDVAGAVAQFEAAISAAEAGTDVALLAVLGRAAADRRQGRPKSAVARLDALAPEGEARTRWLEALAGALSDAGDPRAAAVWAELGGQPSQDTSTQAMALRGQAATALEAGRSDEALRLFLQAMATSADHGEQALAAIGAAEAEIALGRAAQADARLEPLRSHADPEIRLRASLLRASNQLAANDAAAALATLSGLDAAALGPAWDTSLTQIRVAAMSATGDRAGVAAAWEALASRWPDEEEARLPAWLGLAYLADQRGDPDEARALATRARDAATDPGYKELAEQLLTNLGPAPK